VVLGGRRRAVIDANSVPELFGYRVVCDQQRNHANDLAGTMLLVAARHAHRQQIVSLIFNYNHSKLIDRQIKRFQTN